MSFCVGLTPGCAKLWIVSKTRRRNKFGMIGHGECMGTSHNRVQLKPGIVMS